MKFNELTAEYVMSQPWHCEFNWKCGVCVSYTGEDGEARSCVVLQPNGSFKYPDVYQRLCEMLCEEHNRSLRQPKNAWSTDPPTKPGWYWWRQSFHESFQAKIVEVIFDDRGVLHVMNPWSRVFQSLQKHNEIFGKVYWLKIDEPSE